MTIGEDLQYKIGGKVPAWMAGIGVAGLLLVYEEVRKSKAAAAAANQTPAQTAASDSATPQDPSQQDSIDPTTGLPYSEEDQIDPSTGMSYLEEYQQEQNPLSQYLNQNPTNAAFPTGITPSGLPSPVTNAQWEEIAENFLISKGDDPTTVLQALQAFVNGTALNASEQAIVNSAMEQLGAPPQPVTPVVAPTPAPTPAPKPAPKPAPAPAPKPAPKPAPPPKVPASSNRTYTVVRGDTLWGIAAKFYGNGADYMKIFNANRNIISNPNLIFAGQVLQIPS